MLYLLWHWRLDTLLNVGIHECYSGEVKISDQDISCSEERKKHIYFFVTKIFLCDYFDVCLSMLWTLFQATKALLWYM